MGMYTGVRFKGIVKTEFRRDFSRIALFGEWDDAKDETIRSFSEVDRCSFIPCGALSYMPDEWQTNVDEYGDGGATDGFERAYGDKTGYWAFQCSLKNYTGTIEAFLKLLPYFIESVEHLEVFYEEWDWSEKYELIDGEIKMTKDKFVRYNYYIDDDDDNDPFKGRFTP